MASLLQFKLARLMYHLTLSLLFLAFGAAEVVGVWLRKLVGATMAAA